MPEPVRGTPKAEGGNVFDDKIRVSGWPSYFWCGQSQDGRVQQSSTTLSTILREVSQEKVEYVKETGPWIAVTGFDEASSPTPRAIGLANPTAILSG